MSFHLGEIRKWSQAEWINSKEFATGVSAEELVKVSRIAHLGEADTDCLAFYFSADYEKDLLRAEPGILLLGAKYVEAAKKLRPDLWNKTALIVAKDPYLAMAILSGEFARSDQRALSKPQVEENQIHSTAVISPHAKIGDKVVIGPLCVVEAEAVIGDGVVLEAHVWVGKGASIGADSFLFPGVKLYPGVQIGARARIHANVVIGADGFGFAPRFFPDGHFEHQKIHHFGTVRVEADVEIGAGSCIDRGTFGETRIGRGAKIDNLVQIGHNADVGEASVICGCSALAGNSTLGVGVLLGGMSGVSNQVVVGDGAKVGAMTLVTKDVAPGTAVVGTPQREYRQHFRVHALLNKMDKIGFDPSRSGES